MSAAEKTPSTPSAAPAQSRQTEFLHQARYHLAGRQIVPGRGSLIYGSNGEATVAQPPPASSGYAPRRSMGLSAEDSKKQCIGKTSSLLHENLNNHATSRIYLRSAGPRPQSTAASVCAARDTSDGTPGSSQTGCFLNPGRLLQFACGAQTRAPLAWPRSSAGPMRWPGARAPAYGWRACG